MVHGLPEVYKDFENILSLHPISDTIETTNYSVDNYLIIYELFKSVTT